MVRRQEEIRDDPAHQQTPCDGGAGNRLAGNNDSRSGLTMFVPEAQDLLAAVIQLSLVNLFPPTSREPEGVHPIVWGEDDGDTFVFDPAKPLTCAAYIGGVGAQTFVEPGAVGMNCLIWPPS
jgi:hypothetical protein